MLDKMMRVSTHREGLITSLVGDGTPLLSLTAICLMLSGWFALFLSVYGQFLPHDSQFLGIGEDQLCKVADCRVLKFMFHDRASFGGALIAIGWLYLWLVQFPIRRGEAWAWRLFAISGSIGFASFLGSLSYGYLDIWHGVATGFLLPLFLLGLLQSWRSLLHRPQPSLWQKSEWPDSRSSRIGRALLLFTSGGLVLGGTVIFFVGCTTVFVPTDLRYIGLTAEQMHAINTHLVPLIAHDRAGFGGAIGTCGFILLGCIWRGRPEPALWDAIALAGLSGFTAAIGVHPAIGYTEPSHLLPAIAGAAAFAVGAFLCFKPMRNSKNIASSATA